MRELLAPTQGNQARLTRPSPEIVDIAFQMFLERDEATQGRRKAWNVASQFPPYFISRPSNFDYLASLPERLPGTSIAIEFRHPSWAREKAQRTATMKFLKAHGLYYTSIDAPDDKSIVPSFIEATGDQVYLRLHGKNRENWFKHVACSPFSRHS